MDRGTLAEFCQALADAVMEGRLEAAADSYSYPLALYRTGQVEIEHSRADTIRSLTRRMTKAKSHGAVKVDASTGEIDRSKPAGVSFPVEWAFIGQDGKVLDRTERRYFCKIDDGGALRIVMIEMQRRAFEGPPDTWRRNSPKH